MKLMRFTALLHSFLHSGNISSGRRSARGTLQPVCSMAGAVSVMAVILLFAGTAQAQDQFAVDPAQSTVHFSLSDTLHSFGGTFHITSGDISFDRKTGKMDGKIVVAAASGDSGSQARDKRMKKDELKAKNFPDISFQPSSFTGTLADSGSSQIQVSGTFTLLGKPHPLTVPMTVQMDGTHCTTTGTFTVPYVAWGLKDPSMFLVKMQKQVKIDLTLKGQIQPSH